MIENKMKNEQNQTKGKLKTVGIAGGLGPETGCKFCLDINNKFRELTGCQPDVMLENLPVPSKIERQMINGKTPIRMLNLLLEAIKRLNMAKVDFIAIPCNSVHVFIEELREKSEAPVLSIIEECAEECKKRNLNKVGLLASAKTVNEKLFSEKLEKINIDVIIPNKQDQAEINKIIIKIIHNKAENSDKIFLKNIIKNLKQIGAEAIIIGCTDLPLLISEKESCLPLINTLEILENTVIKHLNGELKCKNK